jgi:hypothetical protein
MTDEEKTAALLAANWKRNPHGYWYGPNFSHSQGGVDLERALQIYTAENP